MIKQLEFLEEKEFHATWTGIYVSLRTSLKELRETYVNPGSLRMYR